MQAAVRHFHSPDVDLDSFTPADPEDVSILVQIMVGPRYAKGEESFDVVVCTPAALGRQVAAAGPTPGRHHLIVPRFDWPTVADYLTRLVEEETADTWEQLAERIGRVGRWEFEDYEP